MSALRWLGMGVLTPLAAAATGVAMAVLLGIKLEPGVFIGVTLIVGLPIALLHYALIGGPFYAMAIRRWPVRWWSAALGGAFVGAGPATIFTAILLIGHWARGEAPDLLGALSVVPFGGVPGLVAGLVFRASRGRDPRDAAA
jgi:hypothetical protein